MDLSFLPRFPPPLGDVSVIALILLAGLGTGELFRRVLLLPRISGYVLAGVLLGPGTFGVLDRDMLESAQLLLDIALGLILFELGSRLDWQWFRRNRWLLASSVVESALSFMLICVVLTLLHVQWLHAAIAAAIGVATGASVLLVTIHDQRADGPLTDRAVNLTALNNVFAVVAVTMLLAFLHLEYRPGVTILLLQPLYLLLGSTLLGYMASLALVLLARWLGKREDLQFILLVAMVLAIGRVMSAWLRVRIAGTAKYLNAAGAVVSGSSEAPTPAPLVIRRPVGNAVEGSTVNNTIYLARANRTTDTAAARDGRGTGAMNPQHMRVPVGTTVTFLNPGAAHVPELPQRDAHCATQFFEGKFNPKLNPGETFQYTFDKAGEYFYNDCTDPRPTGKVVAYLTPTVLSNAVRLVPNVLNMRPTSGIFTNGLVTAMFSVPDGYALDGDGDVQMLAPLSTSPIKAVNASVSSDGRTLIASFNKRDITNNVPAGSASLVVSGLFVRNGAQAMLRSTAAATIVK